MKYIALLRGINVGGKNKIPMLDLKLCFEDLGFKNVMTYINSGNVIFETKKSDKAKLVITCEAAIEKRFGFRVVCSVNTSKEIKEAVANAPTWWGKTPDTKHDAFFVIAPAIAKSIMDEVGPAKPEYEKVAVFGPMIFWTAPLETYGRTRYSKIVGTKAYQSVTMRNANTARKLAEL